MEKETLDLITTVYCWLTRSSEGNILQESICSFTCKKEVGTFDMYYFTNFGKFNKVIELSELWPETDWDFRPIYIRELKSNFSDIETALQVLFNDATQKMSDFKSENMTIEANFFEGLMYHIGNCQITLNEHLSWINGLKIADNEPVPILKR